jgi:hypothetical protein
MPLYSPQAWQTSQVEQSTCEALMKTYAEHHGNDAKKNLFQFYFCLELEPKWRQFQVFF